MPESGEINSYPKDPSLETIRVDFTGVKEPFSDQILKIKTDRLIVILSSFYSGNENQTLNFCSESVMNRLFSVPII